MTEQSYSIMRNLRQLQSDVREEMHPKVHMNIYMKVGGAIAFPISFAPDRFEGPRVAVALHIRQQMQRP